MAAGFRGMIWMKTCGASLLNYHVAETIFIYFFLGCLLYVPARQDGPFCNAIPFVTWQSEGISSCR